MRHKSMEAQDTLMSYNYFSSTTTDYRFEGFWKSTSSNRLPEMWISMLHVIHSTLQSLRSNDIEV